ncbi:MAG: hypothetical protein HY928_02285 [Elusimicrobia bacterium]|nr:hypothetical protein [Elusimicrobiota bacterium]
MAPLLLLAGPAAAGLITPGGIFVKDLAGNDRNSVSNNERISLTVKLNNAAASADRIRHLFTIANPAGSNVFTHSGNSVPGSVGNSASQVSGIPVSQFFTGPGVYTFTANATLDAQTVSQTLAFTVSSPNIILIYPPSGAQNVADKPLTFRWVSSGASKYRLTVSDGAGFTRKVFEQTTSGGENFMSYSEGGGAAQGIGAGQVHYWKVEGLDAAGNIVSQSEVPYSFSMLAGALTRDMAITSLEPTGTSGGNISFAVLAANQGGTNESNVTLRFSLGGLPAAGSPVVIAGMASGETREFQFTAALPTDQAQSLAIACLDFFDDNVPNNCKSLQVTRPAGTTADTGFGTGCSSSKPDLVGAIQEKLKSMGYGDYDTGDLGNMSLDDLCALLSQLNENQVQISYTGNPAAAALPPPAAPPPTASAPPPAPAGSAAPLPSVEQEPNAIGREFAGVSLGSLGKDGVKDLVRDKKAFKRLWKRLSNEDAPDLDFKKVMVVALAAGDEEATERFEVEDVVEGLSGLVVRYRAHGEGGAAAAPKKKRAGAPYMLKVVRSSGLDVKFEQVGGEGR